MPPQLTNLRLLFSSANHHNLPSSTAAVFKPNTNLSSSFSLFFKPKIQSLQQPHIFPITNIKPLSFFTAFSSYSKKISKNKNHSQDFPFSNIKHRRNSTSLKGSDSFKKQKKSGLAMEFEEDSAAKPSAEFSYGFNKRRAEGTDKKDVPKKTFQLKQRKLNPINTICYVQVISLSYFLSWLSCKVLLFTKVECVIVL